MRLRLSRRRLITDELMRRYHNKVAAAAVSDHERGAFLNELRSGLAHSSYLSV